MTRRTLLAAIAFLSSIFCFAQNGARLCPVPDYTRMSERAQAWRNQVYSLLIPDEFEFAYLEIPTETMYKYAEHSLFCTKDCYLVHRKAMGFIRQDEALKIKSDSIRLEPEYVKMLSELFQAAVYSASYADEPFILDGTDCYYMVKLHATAWQISPEINPRSSNVYLLDKIVQIMVKAVESGDADLIYSHVQEIEDLRDKFIGLCSRWPINKFR